MIKCRRNARQLGTYYAAWDDESSGKYKPMLWRTRVKRPGKQNDAQIVDRVSPLSNRANMMAAPIPGGSSV
jgi:hypothetical protein